MKLTVVPRILLLLGFAVDLGARQTIALFQPSSLTTGPFPSDILTIADKNQKTRLRVDLPASNNNCDSSGSPAVCSNTALLNQLDGFSVDPRLMVCFSAAIDTKTLVSGVRIAPLDSGPAVGINQIIFDPSSNCAFAKPDQILNQQSQYLITVTDSILDTGGHKAARDEAFVTCLESTLPYCHELREALDHVVGAGSRDNVIAASLFTTMSATTWLEEARDYVTVHQPPVVLPAGDPFSFQLANVKRMTWIPAQSGLPPQDIPLTALSGVGQIAFGLYLSPIFLDQSTGTIPVGSPDAPIKNPIPIEDATSKPGIPLPIPAGFALISFHVFLPAGPQPLGGFPLVIYGHGLGDNQFGAPTFIASTLAKNGFATLAIEITGHGYGRNSIVEITDSNGVVHTLFTPGRGILIPGNADIGPSDGCIVPGAIAVRDCARQTAVDLFALSETIQKTQGLGVINPKKVFYVGQSFGSTYGTLFHAVERNVNVAVLNGDGGSSVNVARLSISGRSLGIEYLAGLGLLNVPPAPPQAYFHDSFNDNYVFPGASAVVNEIPGAMAIQAAFEAADWLGMLGDPLSYAPHLKTSPLDGVPRKSTLFQFGYGDLEVSNPTESAVVRAADAQLSSWFLRFDRATLEDGHPELLGVTMPGVPFPILPHRILSNPTIFDVPAETAIALAEQQQVASYFASNGESNPDPNQFLTAPFWPTLNLFEVPTELPERLNFLQISP